MEVAMQKRFDDYISSVSTVVRRLSPRTLAQSPLALSPNLSRLELPNWGFQGPVRSRWVAAGLGTPLFCCSTLGVFSAFPVLVLGGAVLCALATTGVLHIT